MSQIVKVANLHVSYRGAEIPAVSDVSYSVESSECLAIVGESGSGKSTTALATMKLLDPNAQISASEVRVGDFDILSAKNSELLKIRRDFIGTVFQDPSSNWNPSRKIGDQLLQPFPKSDRSGLESLLIEYMEQVGIDRAKDRLALYPYNLSGGMLQRAMIAGALLGEPKLLIADEPTSALDVTVQADLLRLLSQLQRSKSLSMIIISHNLAVVSQVSTRVLVMFAGTVVESGNTADVLKNPKHPYTRNLIASIPGMQKRRKIPLVTVKNNKIPLSGCRYASRCRYAQDLCSITKPELREFQGQQVACHRIEEIELEQVNHQ
jgi:oligopeptide/dipeptide ABC transporter ATP-binding protein